MKLELAVSSVRGKVKILLESFKFSADRNPIVIWSAWARVSPLEQADLRDNARFC